MEFVLKSSGFFPLFLIGKLKIEKPPSEKKWRFAENGKIIWLNRLVIIEKILIYSKNLKNNDVNRFEYFFVLYF